GRREASPTGVIRDGTWRSENPSFFLYPKGEVAPPVKKVAAKTAAKTQATTAGQTMTVAERRASTSSTATYVRAGLPAVQKLVSAFAAIIIAANAGEPGLLDSYQRGAV
ncbi:MAG: hypothetical protein ACPGAP_03975, partial [Akkermansiaceae bacterium]